MSKYNFFSFSNKYVSCKKILHCFNKTRTRAPFADKQLRVVNETALLSIPSVQPAAFIEINFAEHDTAAV